MKKTILVIMLVVGIFLSNSVLAQDTKPKYIEALEFFIGFGWGKLQTKKDYHLHPLMVDFDFGLKAFTKKFNFNPCQLFQFQIEPFISLVSQPDVNVETGTSFLLKIGFLPQDRKFQPFCQVGVGFLYMTQHTREQSTQFNFSEQCGLGMHYFFNKNTAFTVSGRLRHLSNAGTKYPNHGINTYFALAGITHKF